MRVVVQRVKRAAVSIREKEIARIGPGLLLLVCIERDDGLSEIEWMADKVLNLRIFPDEEEKLNRSLLDCHGEILSVSQFTLAADIGRGRRPDFFKAAPPAEAIPLFNHFNRLLSSKVPVAQGEFGAMMEVELVNDGPVTIFIQKRKPETT